jgi:membrane-associated PAP2 superfamily phosphatase
MLLFPRGVEDYTEVEREHRVSTVGTASAGFVLMTCFYLSLLIAIKYRDYCPRWIRLALAGLGLAAAGFLLIDP